MCPAGKKTPFTHLKRNPLSGSLAIAIKELCDYCISGEKKKETVHERTLKCHFQFLSTVYSQPNLGRRLVLRFNLAEPTSQPVVSRRAESLEAGTFVFAVLMRALSSFIERRFRCKLIVVQL